MQLSVGFQKGEAIPVYRQIAESLKKQIVSDNLPTGGKFPPEPELARQFKTSRVTIRKGLKILEAQGLVSQQRGRGTFVTWQNSEELHGKTIAIIGVSFLDSDKNFTSSIITGIEEGLSSNPDNDLLMLQRVAPDRLLNKIHQSGCDALFVYDWNISRELVDVLTSPAFNDIPMAIVSKRKEFVESDGMKVSLVMQPKKDLALAVDYLVEMGHERIGYITTEDSSNYPDIELRRVAFEFAMHKRGLACSYSYSFPRKTHWFEVGILAVNTIASSPASNRPTAIICPSRVIAHGVFNQAHKLGMRMPEDISIIGFDCEWEDNSRLTSISHQHKKISQKAIKTLLAMLAGASVSERVIKTSAILEKYGSVCNLKKEQNDEL